MILVKIRWREVEDRPNGLYLHDTLDLSEIQRENPIVIRMFPATAQIHAIVLAGSMHVTGQVSADAVYRCSRCLTDFAGELSAELDERFVRRAVTAEEEEENFQSVQGDTVDLYPVIYESLTLALPYQPLCNEQCAGLCSSCGTNLNLNSCSCDTTPIDPRLADLKRLLTDSE
ncbi:MAG: hypothetical protein JWN30_1105 [Bacilli bacterium]|nr:hypothetical protein [Bacilli bacterium]